MRGKRQDNRPYRRLLSSFGAICLLVVALWSAGCRAGDGSTEAATADTTVTDALGRTVVLPQPVRRVVSMAPNLTEIIVAAGAAHRLVGVTTADDFPPTVVDALPAIQALPPNYEAIVQQRPEAVWATDQVNTPRMAETLQGLGVPVYFFSFGSVDDVWAAIRTTGALLGTPAPAGAAADSLAARMDTLRQRMADVAQRPRVLVLIGDETLYAFGGSSYVHTLVAAAGGQSITRTLDAAAPTLSEAYVLKQQPDVIIGAWGRSYDPNRLLKLHPTWDVVPAIRNNRVYSVPADWLLRPGPRLVRGAYAIARALHPQQMPAIASTASEEGRGQ
ncbi:ABC transporter substrate-binding protein [Salisaeta longa]|uniref:ABC transporter substrate-binding protein n=1 Tax=Salisaeta longa TaxID=503170 RepID=UPI0003B44D67|nr:ABC transporter substrate-binding protein [Salisaeta longa]